MRLITLLFGFILSFSSVTASAGSNHDHGHSHGPVSQESAQAVATRVVASFVQAEKIEASWATVVAASTEKKVFKSGEEWVVVFVNEKAADKEKQKLYVFLTLGGEYIAANHTGE